MRHSRRAILWWSIGTVALIVLVMSAYPAVRDNPSLGEFVEDLPETVRTMLGLDAVCRRFARGLSDQPAVRGRPADLALDPRNLPRRCRDRR